MKRPLLSLLVLSLLAASVFASEQPKTERPADNTPKLAYGLLMKQGEKVLFSPCRDRSYALVEDVSSDGRVFKGLATVGMDAGKPLYVELIGVVESGVLKASELNQARLASACRADCAQAPRKGRCQFSEGRLQAGGRAGDPRIRPGQSAPETAFRAGAVPRRHG